MVGAWLGYSNVTVKISYITTDLEFESPDDLRAVVDELAGETAIHLDQKHDGVHRVALGVGVDGSPEQSVAFICGLLEGLSAASAGAWRQCTRRVIDIAFESGDEPTSVTYSLPPGLMARIAELGLGVSVTVYRTGAYSDG